jgi:hypothetical protein
LREVVTQEFADIGLVFNHENFLPDTFALNFGRLRRHTFFFSMCRIVLPLTMNTTISAMLVA